jgi:hypothetical protein
MKRIAADSRTEKGMNMSPNFAAVMPELGSIEIRVIETLTQKAATPKTTTQKRAESR